MKLISDCCIVSGEVINRAWSCIGQCGLYNHWSISMWSLWRCANVSNSLHRGNSVCRRWVFIIQQRELGYLYDTNLCYPCNWIPIWDEVKLYAKVNFVLLASQYKYLFAEIYLCKFCNISCHVKCYIVNIFCYLATCCLKLTYFNFNESCN